MEVLRSRQSPRIAHQNLTLLRAFDRGCIDQELLPINPYTSIIKPLKCSRSGQNRQPFSWQAVERFLTTLKFDLKNRYYYDFCYVMFSLDLRPSEAIGLRWQHIDLDRQQVTICEGMARSEDSKTAGYARQRKSTTTVSVRTLLLTPRLVTLLQGRRSAESQPKVGRCPKLYKLQDTPALVSRQLQLNVRRRRLRLRNETQHPHGLVTLPL